ncbi:SIMPL domain-containing protein, partial [Brucella sp. 21LCYQ03]|nr:SIMPL domain-containing protein [Brucella sp. 21LCYQ03]
YFSGLEDLKLQLISQASENAKLRAQNIATESATSLGQLVKADLGIFQITGQNDNEEYSYGGAFNTSSRSKTANITVKASYLAR